MSTEPKQPHEEELNEAELNQVVGGSSSNNYEVDGIVCDIPQSASSSGLVVGAMKAPAQSTDPVPPPTLTVVHPKSYIP